MLGIPGVILQDLIVAIIVFVILLPFSFRSLWRWAVVSTVLSVAIGASLRSGPGEAFMDQVVEPLRSRSAYERRMDEGLAQLALEPEWQRRAENLSRRRQHELAHDLTRKGLARLDDESLRRWSTLLGQLAGVADAAQCAAIIGGTSTVSQRELLFAKLGPEAFETWVDLSIRAALAELRQVPAPAVDRRTSGEALEALIRGLPGEQRGQLRAVIIMAEKVTPEKQCWATRTVHTQLAGLREEYQRALTRALAQPR